MLNRKQFYGHIRASLFRGGLTQAQVDGCNALLDACERHSITARDMRWTANVLAQVYHETGGHMAPIKETVQSGHKNKRPSDSTVIRRLDRAWAKGQLPWVKEPYWREGWFGRGQIMLTHRENYRNAGERLGVDLLGKPRLALDPRISADIAVRGMREAWFRPGHGLSRYFNAERDDPVNARRIVNGPDGTEQAVAGYHAAFLEALRAAAGAADEQKPVPAPPVPDHVPAPDGAPEGRGHWLGKAIAWIIGIGMAAAAAYFGWG